MIEQPDFLYYECPECEWSEVVLAKWLLAREKDWRLCSLCLSDTGHEVVMRARVCRDVDEPEGYDARKNSA